MVVALKDLTANSIVSSVTVNQAASGFVDSGAFSAAMTAGDKFALGESTVPTGCITPPVLSALTAVYK